MLITTNNNFNVTTHLAEGHSEPSICNAWHNSGKCGQPRKKLQVRNEALGTEQNHYTYKQCQKMSNENKTDPWM